MADNESKKSESSNENGKLSKIHENKASGAEPGKSTRNQNQTSLTHVRFFSQCKVIRKQQENFETVTGKSFVLI